MNSFLVLFLGMGLSSMFYDNWSPNFDIIGSLPVEVAVIILRKLDAKSLITAISVCSKWMRIVKSDKTLRKTVRDELIRQRKERMERELFFSASIKAVANASFSEALLAAKRPRDTKRKFEVSIKTVNKPLKKRKVSWEVSTSKTRKLR